MRYEVHLTTSPNVEAVEPGVRVKFGAVARIELPSTEFPLEDGIWVELTHVHVHSSGGFYFEGVYDGREVIGHYKPCNLDGSWMTTKHEHPALAVAA